MLNPSRILSIQSNVVRGAVGNRSAVFPLQFLKHHVDIVNSVEFTSMYIHEGLKIPKDVVRTLLNTLPQAQKRPSALYPGMKSSETENSEVIDHKYVITGYVYNGEFLEEVFDFIKKQKSMNAQFYWVCDPAIGDRGKIYIDPDTIKIYRKIISEAYLITPNHFELQWLSEPSDQPILTIEDAIARCKYLHTKGVMNIVVTSFAHKEDADMLHLIASELSPDRKQMQVSVIEFPNRKIYLGGTGDLMTAMIVHFHDISDGSLFTSCMNALKILQGVISYTLEHYESPWEIDVIQSASIFHNPPKTEYKSFTYKYVM